MHIEFFEGERATQYDDRIPTWVPNYQFVQQSVPSILKSYLPVEGERKLLIAGCGTGQEISEIKRLKTAWKVTGIDPSPQMIRLAQMKLAYRENDTHLLLKTGVVSDLPADQKYDAATLILVMHFIPDTEDGKLNLLRNIAQRLHSGAPLIISDIYAPEDFQQQRQYFRQYMISKGLEPQMVDEGLQHVKEDTHRLTTDRLGELLQEAGFHTPHMFSKAFYYGGWVVEKR
ncbi:class I SAM-dependent methyltransferase [Catalinimonas niigatensis]|uniref:class I SAM-dependent methyltransferase n=1 Tax=Catalinimonas niigatensis TaxID=1397264 RepID=UPI0026662F27|nr:class I SAM-dependent methyltransferase [Catalinimonas niigatensis]WPP48871.1 class I SAM-dependent methyltransferase [Catalinimonas niigatensis]